ncbi:Proteinaceous RNase P 1, chloroplastic/mitochondrial [Linum grandiflorum]
MLQKTCLSPVVTRTSPLLVVVTSRIPLMSFLHHSYHHHHHTLQLQLHPPLLPYSNGCLFAKPTKVTGFHHFGRANLYSVAAAALSPTQESSSSSVTRDFGREKKKAQRKAARNSPEGVLRQKLDMCSKGGDLDEALRLYDEARSNEVPLNQHSYNVLLYLCSSPRSLDESAEEEGSKVSFSDLGLRRGFEIFQQMVLDKIDPNEASFTNAARLAAGLEDPDMAFELVKQMKTFNIPPKLRSYGPALFGYCSKGMADRAYEVYLDMIDSGVMPEEPEVSALLKVSADAEKADWVYEMLHRLRTTVRQVAESTMNIVEDWFNSEAAGKVGEVNWDVRKIREGVVKGGGGWHGQGWLGSGPWRVVRTQLDEQGVCRACAEKLVCIDIDPRETEHFASSLSNLACKKEAKADFIRFQEWLRRNGPFDAVVDGANISLVNQLQFNFHQLNIVVNKLRQMSPSKRYPLIILHKSRVTGGSARSPNNLRLLEKWAKAGALYATPPGSNDDWYWLYAAVSFKSLLVTNDEMRDHLFQLLGTSFFPRWKEKHQVRMSVSTSGVKLHMPPPYSIVTQESEKGSWHVPMKTDDGLETPRQWLCATRQRA